MGKRTRYKVNTTNLHKLSQGDLVQLARVLMYHFKPEVEREVEEEYWAGHWYKHTRFFVVDQTDGETE